MPGKIFRQKGDEAAAIGRRLIAFLRPLGPKKEGITPLLCEWIKTVGFLFLGILERDVVFGLRRGVNAAGQAGNQHVQETLVGLYHVIVGIAHILRSFHGGVLQRDQTEDYAMVPRFVHLHQRFGGFDVSYQDTGIVARGKGKGCYGNQGGK